MKIVVALVLLVVISLVFHWWSPWWMTPVASNWGNIDTTINITLYITAVVFVAVNLFMAWAIFRYRHNPSRRSHYEPENKKLEIWLTVITTVGVAAMLAPGLVVWADFVNVPENADEVEVVGEQWQWSYRLPGVDGVLGEVDSRYVKQDNPFGMSPNDPAGGDDVLVSSNELHLPIDRPVKLLLRSKDVLHNFAVPQFRVKMDLVPGMVTYVWLTPTRTGKFDILCMELCGIAHYTMRGYVVVDQQDNLYISDTMNHRVRKVEIATGLITTVAGNGDSGYEDKNMGGCGAARFVAKESAGTVKHGDGLLGIEAVVNSPVGLSLDSQGYLYICERGENKIRRVKLW